MSDETREYFQSVADQWDEMRRTFFGEGVRNSAMAAAGITPSSVVVDVGTGTGFMAEGALAAGAHVIGVDSSDRMLVQARNHLSQPTFETRVGDVESLPIRDEEGGRGSSEYGAPSRARPDACHSRNDARFETRWAACNHRRRHARTRMAAHRTT